MTRGFWAALLLALLQWGCSNIAHKPMAPQGPERRKIAIFFDGTRNDEASDTNVKKLHSLVALQDQPGLATLWIEGVGTGADVAGMAFGVGTSSRVRLAYEFLLNTYRDGDQIYLFGFSRGAWNARVLASMLFNVGLPRWPGHTVEEIADTAFEVFKGVYRPAPSEAADCGEMGSLEGIDDHQLRRVAVQTCLRSLKFEPPRGGSLPTTQSAHVAPVVSVEVLGLWDTVEALGLPDWGARLLHKLHLKAITVDVDTPNRRYGDQLCNVRLALQALSIDDNREWIFTPLPLSRTHLFKGCPALEGEHVLEGGADGAAMRIAPGRLREVWFAGAHSDVGGGRATSLMSGVSLNWMIDQLRPTGLLSAGARVREDVYGSSHDPEAGLLAGAGYHAISRNLAAWALSDRQREEFRGSLCVHPSVFERRRALRVQDHENASLRLLGPDTVCLVADRSEGASDPERLREAPGGGADARPDCARRLHVQAFGECQGMQ